MRLEVITPPASEPLSLTDAKAHLRVSTTSEDTLITRLISAARMQVEGATRRRLITQKWRVYCDRFPGAGWLGSMRPLYMGMVHGSDFVLPDVAPVATVDALKYIDTTGTLQTLDPSVYQLIAEAPARVALAYGQDWPGIRGDRDGVRIEVTSGYGAASAVPADIVSAMCLILGHLYEHREEASDFQVYRIPAGADALLSQYMAPAF